MRKGKKVPCVHLLLHWIERQLLLLFITSLAAPPSVRLGCSSTETSGRAVAGAHGYPRHGRVRVAAVPETTALAWHGGARGQPRLAAAVLSTAYIHHFFFFLRLTAYIHHAETCRPTATPMCGAATLPKAAVNGLALHSMAVLRPDLR